MFSLSNAFVNTFFSIVNQRSILQFSDHVSAVDSLRLLIQKDGSRPCTVAHSFSQHLFHAYDILVTVFGKKDIKQWMIYTGKLLWVLVSQYKAKRSLWRKSRGRLVSYSFVYVWKILVEVQKAVPKKSCLIVLAIGPHLQTYPVYLTLNFLSPFRFPLLQFCKLACPSRYQVLSSFFCYSLVSISMGIDNY